MSREIDTIMALVDKLADETSTTQGADNIITQIHQILDGLEDEEGGKKYEDGYDPLDV